MSSIKYLLVMLFSIAVAACGGGGGGSSPPASNTLTGIVAKGPVDGAQVLVFKAGDYSGVAASGVYPDDTKALNYNSPAHTTATGSYSVNVGSNSGPFIIVVRPISTGTGSHMFNELTGASDVFGFRMRAAVPGVAANTTTTANITPFTEMAAHAVGTSTDPAVINTANALVRTQVLSGLDPLTTSPVVDSNAASSVQATQTQMVVPWLQWLKQQQIPPTRSVVHALLEPMMQLKLHARSAH